MVYTKIIEISAAHQPISFLRPLASWRNPQGAIRRNFKAVALPSQTSFRGV
jgi:hypothetical protein